VALRGAEWRDQRAQGDLGKGFLRGRLRKGFRDGKGYDEQAMRLFVNDRIAPYPDLHSGNS
jgi:hypothetical protein